MQFFIFLALFIVPLTTVQLYSTASHALTNNKADTEYSINGSALSKSFNAFNNKTASNSAQARFINNEIAEVKRTAQRKTKKVRVFTGNKNSQGMQLLSVLLMLKDKKR